MFHILKNKAEWEQYALLLGYGVRNDDDREILGNSLFYYCCGKDPTPVIAFGSEYPFYVYADLVRYGHGDFDTEVNELLKRLKEKGFKLLKKEKLREIGVGRKIKTILLTKWADKNGTFYLAYLQGDALVVFDSLYRDDIKGCNSIQPRCICNYRYDCDNPIWERNKLSFLEKRAEYLFGYCYSDKYRCIGEYDYYGDYGTVTKIPLYRRRYWYV